MDPEIDIERMITATATAGTNVTTICRFRVPPACLVELGSTANLIAPSFGLFFKNLEEQLCDNGR